MRQRIAAAAAALPEPVVAKLLDMEAGELDLLLQYPAAAAAQVCSVAAGMLLCLTMGGGDWHAGGAAVASGCHCKTQTATDLVAILASHLSAVPGYIQAQDLLAFHDEHGAAVLEARDAPQLTWEQVHWPRPCTCVYCCTQTGARCRAAVLQQYPCMYELDSGIACWCIDPSHDALSEHVL